jgi:hypothetical protein
MRLIAIALFAVCAGVIAFTGASYLWLAPACAGLVGAWLMRRDRCEHLYPALLPAIRHADGTTLPAKWFCCDCGDSWAVNPHRNHRGRDLSPSARRSMLSSTSVATSATDQVA